MFTTLDKALAALVMGVAFLINTYTNFHFSLSPETVDGILAVITPLLVWLVPNKAAPAVAKPV